jgi:uncharacterized membrane protein
VTVTTLNPDCESKASFLEISLALAAVASDVDISTKTMLILAILVSVDSFFICLLLVGWLIFWLYSKLGINSRH